MSLEQKIMTELKTAMLAKDEKALRSLRAVKAAILLAKTSEGAGGELKEEDETKLLQKQEQTILDFYSIRGAKTFRTNSTTVKCFALNSTF